MQMQGCIVLERECGASHATAAMRRLIAASKFSNSNSSIRFFGYKRARIDRDHNATFATKIINRFGSDRQQDRRRSWSLPSTGGRSRMCSRAAPQNTPALPVRVLSCPVSYPSEMRDAVLSCFLVCEITIFIHRQVVRTLQSAALVMAATPPYLVAFPD